MQQNFEQLNELDVEQLELVELREHWAQAWKIKPQGSIWMEDHWRGLSIEGIALENNCSAAYVSKVMHAGGIDDVFCELFEKKRPITTSSSTIWKEFWERLASDRYSLPDLEAKLLEAGIINLPENSQPTEDATNLTTNL